jgi:hypothetical protein
MIQVNKRRGLEARFSWEIIPDIMSYLWGFSGFFEVEYSMPRRLEKFFAALLGVMLDQLGPSLGPPTEIVIESPPSN